MPRCTPAGERLAPAGLVGHRVEHGQVLGPLVHECAAELQGVLAGSARHFVHEALEIDGVLVGVDAAPGADRHMRVAHGVFDEQVRHSVAELRVAGRRGIALQLPIVLAVGHRSRIDERVDRLPRDAQVQGDEIVGGVQPSRQPALRDRPVEVVHHVFFPRPDHLDRHAGDLLGDQHRLAHVVLRAAAPAEAAAGIGLVDLALGERQAGRLGRGGERAFAILGRRPHLAACSGVYLAVQFIGSMQEWLRKGVA